MQAKVFERGQGEQLTQEVALWGERWGERFFRLFFLPLYESLANVCFPSFLFLGVGLEFLVTVIPWVDSTRPTQLDLGHTCIIYVGGLSCVSYYCDISGKNIDEF